MKRVTRQCHKTLSTTVKWNENIVTTSHCVSTTDLSKWHFHRHHINNQSSLTTVVSFTQHILKLYTFFHNGDPYCTHIYFPYHRILNCYRRSVNLLNFTITISEICYYLKTFTMFLSQNIFQWLISTVALHLRSLVYIGAQWISSDQPRKVGNTQYGMNS